MIDYDSFSRCHLTEIFFRFSRGSKRVNGDSQIKKKEACLPTLAKFYETYMCLKSKNICLYTNLNPHNKSHYRLYTFTKQECSQKKIERGAKFCNF